MCKGTKAFDEFAAKRCEEVLSKDDEYRNLNKSIIDLENKFRSILSLDQLKTFNEYESLVIGLGAHAEQLLYKQGYLDAKDI